MKRISILGSTGSIGTQSLAVVDAFPEQFEIIGLSAGRNLDLLKKQILKYQPKFACIQSDKDALMLDKFIRQHCLPTQCVSGQEGLKIISMQTQDLLIVAIFGTTALYPTSLAIEEGTTIGLACKEILVSGGDLIMTAARAHNVRILPIDSEHAAIQQCLSYSKSQSDIRQLILTASGGPFRSYNIDQLSTVTRQDALNHPNWEMGQKITIDSATMMNKGFEVIEAHYLFDVPFSKIDVVIHPQSIIHSLVEFIDGHLLAQLCLPDMRLPIQYVMTYPDIQSSPWPKTTLTDLPSLSFDQPNLDLFPLLRLAYEAGQEGGSLPVVLNSANDAAVDLFLNEKIGFLDIFKMVEAQLNRHQSFQPCSIDDITQLDLDIKQHCYYAFQ